MKLVSTWPLRSPSATNTPDPLAVTEQRNLDAYLEWVFNTPRDQLRSTPPIPLPLLAARLQTGHIVRVGART